MEKTISEFLSDEYREFAMYTIENRAIPSVIDGFKNSQRKIIHVSSQIWRTGKEKTLKVFQLAGKVASDSYYHHGNNSLENAIINMAQSFKNNAPLLEEDGQFGSLRSPQAGAPRYIGTKLSDNFRLIYKDFDLLKYKEEEGESIEPEYFLPIIPTVLVNGTSGIAVGFSSNILNRDIKDIIEACKKTLNGVNIRNIKPHLNSFNGEYIQDEDNKKKWYIRGKFEIKNTTTVKINELPPSMTYEKYEEYLDKLVENKDIVSYDDNCKDNVDYTIKFTRSALSDLSEENLIKLLKLEESVTEIYTILDENGKLKIFENIPEIIKYFVDFRLKYYLKRKEFLINKIEKDLKILKNKSIFLKSILDSKLIINNVSKTKIISDIEKMNLDKIDNSFDYLLRMPIYSLTKELFENLIKDLNDKEMELNKIKLVKVEDMYIEDLNNLKKNIKQ